MYWPIPVDPRDVSVDALVQMFRSLGYEDAGLDAHPESAVEKVALFGSALFYTHAARQLPNGKWTSKLGKAEDIEHDTPHDVGGGIYGELVRIMKRPVRPAIE
ncbi:MAG TPA: hypothetical protein VFA18_14540 [Gemmataceae bacterium]|nr:hypothetical protein [Gemmataceae bacterium]